MEENKKEALKMFLEYIFEETGNKNEIETIVETYVNKKLKDYFDVVANKIDATSDEIQQLKKSLNQLPVRVDHVPTVEVNSKNNITKTQKRKLTKNELPEKILACIPEMTAKECSEYFKKIQNRCKNVSTQSISQKLQDEATPQVIAKKIGYTRGSVGNALSLLEKRDDIKFIKVNTHPKAPKVYVRIIPESETSADNVDPNKEYLFTSFYVNPGYELINNQNIKTKRGKLLTVDAKQLKELSKLVDGKILTVGLFNDCCKYLKDCGVPESDCERIIQHLTKGYFSMVLSQYDKHLYDKWNPHFEVYNDTLLVNGQDTKLTVKEVNDMINDYPYGFSNEKIEQYVRKMIDQYTFCPAECIRVILRNYDNYSLKHLLKEKKSFVENNPRKRKEKGII